MCCLKKHRYMGKMKYCLIINNFTFENSELCKRYGSHNDVKMMQRAFFKYNFHLKMCMDPTLNDLRNQFKILCEENLNNVDCLVVVLMTHGGKQDFAYAKDKDYNITNEIVNSKVFMIFDKPKILITQCCKQDDAGQGTFQRNKSVRNLFRFDSTYEGCSAYRNNDGSEFIKHLFEELMKYDSEHDFEKAANGVINKFKADGKQRPTIEKC